MKGLHETRETYTMIGPSFGTFSPPMTWISVKKDTTAQLAIRRMILCATYASDMTSKEGLEWVVTEECKESQAERLVTASPES